MNDNNCLESRYFCFICRVENGEEHEEPNAGYAMLHITQNHLNNKEENAVNLTNQSITELVEKCKQVGVIIYYQIIFRKYFCFSATYQ